MVPVWFHPGMSASSRAYRPIHPYAARRLCSSRSGVGIEIDTSMVNTTVEAIRIAAASCSNVSMFLIAS